MTIPLAAGLLAWALLQAPAPPPAPASAAPPAAKPAVTGLADFHHLHLMGPGDRIDFYEQLFPATAIVRGTFWGAEGIRGDDVFLLWSRSTRARSATPSAIWHFGWGKVSTGESYRDHLLEGVNWKPPYPSLTTEFHVHLRSRDPRAAAAWYEEVLGAVREEGGQDDGGTGAGGQSESAGQEAAGQQAEGQAEALVRLGKILLVIHRTTLDLASSRDGGSSDHLAFTVPDIEALKAQAKARGVPVVEPRYTLDEIPTLMLEGPDRIVLEFLERPKGPGFWQDRR